jgi:hypothetical protein
MSTTNHVKEVATWVTLVAALLGGAFWAEDRYANAGETATTILTQKLVLRNEQESKANENRLERMQRELTAIHARRASGALYQGDQALIGDLNEEIRIAREYRSALRQQASQIK